MPSKRAKEIATRCSDAYSADAYGSWAAVADALLKLGCNDLECEAIMRSKWTRWARDAATKNYRWGKYPASVVIDYIRGERYNACSLEEIQTLTFETFGRYE